MTKLRFSLKSLLARLLSPDLFAICVLLVFYQTGTANAQHIRIFACAIANDSTGAAMGGSSNGSGLYQSDDTGKTWRHLGWNNIKCYSMDEVQSSNGKILYEATGLGVLRSVDGGEHWKQLTDWRISEAMDVAVNQKNPNEIYIATAHGPWRTRDGGKMWQQLSNGLPVPYCSRIVVDSIIPEHVILASETGIYALMSDSNWLIIPATYTKNSWTTEKDTSLRSVRSILQLAPDEWIAAADGFPILYSWDSAKSFGANFSYPYDPHPAGLWSVSEDYGYFSSPRDKYDSWHLTLGGGPLGVIFDQGHHDVSRSGKFDCIKNVASTLVIAGSKFSDTRILGTLGDGLYVRIGKDDLFELAYESTTPAIKHKLLGDQFLPDRQIWTLKSFLVSP